MFSFAISHITISHAISLRKSSSIHLIAEKFLS